MRLCIIPEGHPLYQRNNYYDIPVHGGITFDGFMRDLDPEYFTEDCFAIGFDINHGWDREYMNDKDYVEKECKKLIDYLIETF